MSKQVCYNCGIELTEENSTVEHIPAKNLFIGYDESYKKNRITVPACQKCNVDYSKIDQEVRDLIGIANDDLVKDIELTQKSVRSILRRSSWKDRVYFNPQGQQVTVDFSYNDLRTLHIKNFKGLFFAHYGSPIPDDYQIEIIADGDEKLSEVAQGLYQYLGGEENWKHSGHADIFKYKMKTLTPNEKDEIIHDDNLEKALGIVCIMVYHDKVASVVVAAKKDVLDQIKGRG